MKVLETGQQVEGQLAQKQASLGASRADFERKQAEVSGAAHSMQRLIEAFL